MKRAPLVAAAFLLCASSGNGMAAEAMVTYKSLSPDIALKLAQAALKACRDHGFQVAVAVVDRFGQPQVMLRDQFAGAHTPTTATGKAWTAASFRTNTSELVDLTKPDQPQAGLRNLPHVVLLGGGVMVESAGSLVGAVGVSGGPRGEDDEACANAGIDAIRDKLDF